MRIRPNHWLPILAAILICAPVTASADSIFDWIKGGERGSGDIVEEEREVDDFDQILLACSADLIIRVGEERSVIVITDDNLQDNVITDVSRSGTLTIDTRRSYRSRHGVIVEISVPNLKALEVDGSGDVEVTGVEADKFVLELDGSGNLDLEGRVEQLEIELDGSGEIHWRDLSGDRLRATLRGSGDIDVDGDLDRVEVDLDGSGDINLRRLKANLADVRLDGSGDIKVFARESFTGFLNGSGDIDVYGDPEDVDKDESGSGDITIR